MDDNTFYTEIGSRIAFYRKEQTLTQREIAKKLGTTQEMIAYYEKGKRRLPISFVEPLSKILCISIETLLNISKKNKPGPLSKIERKLEVIRNLPKNKQEKVLDLIDKALDIAK